MNNVVMQAWAICTRGADMKNDVVIITGAAMGLGQATAKELAGRGAHLALVDYNSDCLERTRAELAAQFRETRIVAITADVSDEKAVKRYVDETLHAFGKIDGLYNNAGIEGPQASLTQYDLDAFKKVLDINLMGVYYGMRHVIPVMQKQQYGRIVNVSSVAGIRGILDHTPYVASKHAVAGMTKNAALEYGREGVLTNAIAPGAILTPMVAGFFKQMNPDNPQAAEKDFARHNPMRRLGQPEEVAKLAAFFLSRDNSYVNGQVIAIDGGESNVYGNV
jgi:NAD(P)-dependent dehydrogenase (short-subunit alcohol dehydrogenase family)